MIATRPATAPEQMPTTVGLPRCAHSTNIQVRAATAVAIWVTVIAMPACTPALTAEPALKPNQPTHRRRGADEGQDHVVARARVAALAEHDRGDETGDARVDVHDRAAGEVENLDPGVGRWLELKMPSGPQTQWATGA